MSERTRGQGKKASRKLASAAALAAVGSLAMAGPLGGQVTAGTGSISQSGTTTTINQGSQNLSLNWQSFSTSSGETVNFVQPSASATAVNRISDTSATQFFGNLNANGQVYLVNPNGILFGAGSQVNVGSLVASTLDISDAALGSNSRNFSGAGAGSIVNQGTINAANGGYVALLGKQVTNNGTITTPGGTTALGAGSDVTLSFAGNSLVNLQVNQSTLESLAENGGLIQADGGAVVMTAGARDAVLASVVNNTGIIQAKSVQNVNGTIVLEAGANGAATNSGTLDASGKNAGETGGTVKVLGGSVNLLATSVIDVSGDSGGGTALIGGNFHGAGSEQNAQNTSIAAGSTINADAITSGNGGNVAVWSDGTTQFDSSITARGGTASGNGGKVETSGLRLRIAASAAVNTLAARGTAGNWLLDPNDIIIGNRSLWDSTTAATIDVDSLALTRALNTGNVTIKTTNATPSCTGGVSCTGHAGNGDIVVLDVIGAGNDYSIIGTPNVNWNTGSFTLTLSAYRNIQFKYTPNVNTTAGTSNQGGGIAIDTNTGNIILRADNSATGAGTVVFDALENFISLNNASSRVNIYYNPSSYSSPTDYTQNLWANTNQLTAYMAVNLVVGSIATKTYDGNDVATLSGLAPLSGSMPNGLTLDASSPQARFSDKNAGTDKTVTISGVAFTGGGSTIVYNGQSYYLNGLDSKTGTITPKTIGVSGVAVTGKTYDATTTATLSGASVAGSIISGDVVSVSGGSGTFSDANAGVNKAVTVSGYTLSGTDAGNYVLTQPTGVTGTINKAGLILSGSKTYDGTTIVAGSTLTATGVAGQTFTVTGSGDASDLSSKNVQTGSTLSSVTGLALGSSSNGGLSTNYNALSTTGSSYSVTAKDITLNGIAASDKVYDTTTGAILDTSNVSFSGMITGDSVALSGSGTGSFATKDVGVSKNVTVSGYTLSGIDAGNYVVAQPTGLTATISKADLAVSGVAASNKTYDATTAATLSSTASVTAMSGDVVSVGGTGTGTFADANAGTGKTVNVTGYTLTGTDAGNYNIIQPTGVTATINKADLILSGSKTYDGTTTVAGSTLTATGVNGQTFSVNGAGSSANLASKNVADNNNAQLSSVAGLSLGSSSNGGLSSNYNVLGVGNSTYTVTAKGITLTGITASDKIYDTTTAATLNTSNVSYSGIVAGDNLTLSGSGTGSFATKDAGANKTVSVSGYTLIGTDAGNYVVAQPAGLTATISKADLQVSGISAADKTYDGSTSASLSGTASVTALSSDVVSVAGTGSATFANQNAGANKSVTVTGYTLSGTDANNYNVVQPTGVSASINKADLTLSGNRTYNGTTIVAGSTLTATGVNGETFSVSGAGDSSNLASKNVADNNNAQLSSVAGLSLGSSSNGGLSSNYNVLGVGNSTYTVTAKGITLTGITASDKIYDTTTAATLNTSNVSYSGIVAGDNLTLSGSGTGSFATKDAGANKTVTVSGYTLSGTDAGNYVVAQPTGLTATISKADLQVSGISANNKTYDATTTATLSGTASVTGLLSDAVSVTGTGSGTFADANAGTDKAVTVTGYTLSGTDAGNYKVVQPTGVSASINKADLILSGSKTYDGTTTVTGSTLTATGVNGQTFTVTGSGDASNLASKNVQTGSPLSSVAGLALGASSNGGLSTNYNVLSPTGSSYTVTAKGIMLAGIRAADKTYDATTGATLDTTNVSYSGLISGDNVALSGTGIGAFATKDAGVNKAVTVSGYTLSGSDAGNYAVSQPSNVTATINKAGLLITGLSANNKTYDGGTTTTLSGTAAITAISTDVVSLAGTGVGNFADKNVGTGKSVVISGYTLTGTDAGNYNIGTLGNLTANITPLQVIVSGITANNKTYDGTTAATVNTSGVNIDGKVAGDDIRISSTGSFTDKNAGSNKTVNLMTTYGGNDLGNYSFVNQTTTQASIAKADVAVTGISTANKTYDGTTLAALNGTATVTAFAGDTVTVGGNASGSFADKSVGTGKAVTVTGYILAGADAGNYNLAQPSGLTANITQANLNVAGITAANKAFDGNTTATVNTGAATLDGLITGDRVALESSGAFADAAAGTGKMVNLSNSISGIDSSNYRLTGQTTTLADIVAAIPPAPEQTIQNVLTQVQSSVLPQQAAVQLQTLNLSPTIVITQQSSTSSSNANDSERNISGNTSRSLINTNTGFGTPAPTLNIQNGGVQLPPIAISFAE